MKRRDVMKGAMGAAGLVMLPQVGLAQDAKTFKMAKRDVPPSTPGKMDVVEFFWYGCPHCYAFESKLNQWVKALPPDVVFTKVPVRWPTKRVNFEGHQKLYYALEAMNRLADLHLKVFEAMHKDKKLLATDAEIFDFAQSLGLNREAFANAFKSFAVSAKCAKAASLMESYDIEGVPTLGIGGKFSTSATQAGSEDKVLVIAQDLIKRRRQG